MRKKIVSLLLAAAMSLSVMSPFAGTAFAEEAEQSNTTQVETVQATDENADTSLEMEEDSAAESEEVRQLVSLFEALPAADAVAGMTDEERSAAAAQVADALNAFDALSAEDGAAFLAGHEELYKAVSENLLAALMATPEDTPSDLSLRPMEETSGVYLTLNGYTKEQLQNFSLDKMLTMLTDEMGNPITVDQGYTHAWVYFQGDDLDEYHNVGAGETVDLWNYDYVGDSIPSTSYTIFLVLSQGNQMEDSQNHRYKITVELSTEFEESFYLSVYLDKEDGSDSNAYAARGSEEIFKTLGMKGRSYTYFVGDHQDGEKYCLDIYADSAVQRLLRDGVQLEVYPMGKFLDYRDNGAELTGEITDQVFYHGYFSTFDTEITAQNCDTADNLLCFVFRNKESGRIIDYFGAAFTVRASQGKLTGRLWSDQKGSAVQVSSNSIYQNSAYFGGALYMGPENSGFQLSYNSYASFSFSLPEGVPVDDLYKMTLDANQSVKKVYEGAYTSESKAKENGAKDVTSKIFYDPDKAPAGYEVNPAVSHSLTLIMEDGSALMISVYAYESGQYYGNNDVDPDFQITGVSLPGKYLDTYVASSVSGIQLDTYYRNDEKYDVGGYQLIMIKDQLSEQEMKQLIPSFSTPDGVVVNSGSRVESGRTNLSQAVWSDSLADTVMYQVQVPGKKLKNYQVTFATQKDKGTLYIAGPDERFINLTADNKYLHDILIANIGATDLEGVKVELLNPVNIKLDEYWTLNGDTIPAFTQTSSVYQEKDENGQVVDEVSNRYANPDNIAKIRLLADGEGEISGTLRVTTADGQRRDIKLTGIAANPHIVSGPLQDAVKYVPYSYMVVTDNMYNWNRLSFKILDGALPAGMHFYESTGEIYGTPQETGDFSFTVQVDYGSSRFQPSTATYTLHVADNSNQAVFSQTDKGYEIQVPLGVEQGEGTCDFLLTDLSSDQLYVSDGVYPEFVALWLNGKRLVQGVDYTAVSGSTRITIKSQTLQDEVIADSYNTIAAEFRVDGNRNNELKRTAQNFRIGEIKTVTSDDENTNSSGSSSGNSSAGNQEQTDTKQTAGQDAAAQTDAQQAAAAQAAALAAQGVNLRFYVVDAQGNPVSGVKAELHSTPRTGTTNANGCVAFSHVEFGPHTLTVYDADGSVLGSKSFELVSGTTFGVNGDVITVLGGSTLSIQVQTANGSLAFTRVDLPQTGDSSHLVLWVALFAVAACACAGVNVYRKKRSAAAGSGTNGTQA